MPKTNQTPSLTDQQIALLAKTICDESEGSSDAIASAFLVLLDELQQSLPDNNCKRTERILIDCRRAGYGVSIQGHLAVRETIAAERAKLAQLAQKGVSA